MQQPQSRPLLGDSVSSTTSPNARPRNNPVAVLTQQQLQQLQQLQAQNTSGQSLTFALQQTSSNPQEQGNGSTTGNHIVYVNQLNQLNQSTINPSGTGMGLPPATPTFGVGLNMGLPLSLLNTSLTSLTSNVITTSNPLLNLGLPSINTGLTAINPSLNHLNAINSNLTSNIGSNNINNGLSNLGQDINSINTGVNTGINRLNTINSTNINSGLSGVNAGLTGVNPNLTTLNSSNVNQNLTLNTNLTATNSGVSGLSAINPNANLTTTSINSGVNQGLNRSVNALATGLTPTSLNSSSAQFPFPAIQSIQSIAPHIVGSSNLAHVPNSAISQHPNTNISPISNSGTLTSSSIFTSTPSESIHTTTANVNHASNVNLTTNIPHLGTMHANLSNISTSNVHISASNEPIMSLSHVSSLSSSQSTGFQPQRQYSQGINPGLSASVALTGTTQPSNVVSTMNTVKSMQNIQNQNISSPGSPFSIPLKSPASNIAPPTPSPSPNRLLLRSPASNSIQSNRNSPSPVGTSTSNSNFNIQMQSPMQSPMSVSQIQSPVLSPYPPAKSPHLLGGNNSLNNRSPAPGGSPGPPVVRPNTPILQQGMQVLQIIHGTPQGYQSTPTQLVTRTQLFGNQQIQIAAKPAKQPPQILPKPPNQQAVTSQQKPQRATTTITNQVTQQTQPQLVLAGPQPSPTTATMIPTAQGLVLNQVLPSTGPVIVQQQPGGVQLILRTPASAQQQTHTAQLTQQQLVRVVTAQGMQLQGITPAFFAVPNGFPPTASPVIRHTPSSPAPSNSGTGNSIVIQNAMVQSPQSQIAQVTSGNTASNASCTQTVSEQNLLPPPKKKAKKKKKAKRKDDEPPKLDLASIMKISGIGDDDDIFDTELTTETEIPCQVPQQSETNSGQSLGQLSSQGTIPANSTQNLIQVPATNTTNTQASVSQTFNSQLVAQLQMPVQNAISGQLRLAVGEDGKVVLHHTPEPNQPEIDSATAQALIRSLTQSSGQNSQIISQLFGQAQNTSQPAQTTTQQRPKFVKSPLSSGNQVSTNTVSSTCSQNIVCTTSPHHSQIYSKSMNQQKNINIVSQETNSIPSICVQNNLGPLQSLEIQTSKNVNVQNLMQSKSSNPILSQSGNVSLNTSDILSAKPSPTMFNIQGPRMSNTNQINSNQQNSNISLQKSSQVRLTNACITTNIRQNLGKQTQQQQHGVHVQKSLPGSSIVQNDHISKANQSLQQTSQQETLTLQQESPLFQHNQQITAQTVQTQNVQQIFEQNLQSSNIHHNSMNILQQQSSCNAMQQHDTMNVLHSSIQQNTINVLQQNTAGNVQNIEQNLQSGTIKDIAHTQQNVMTSLQQQNTSAVLHNTSVQQNVNVQQQKVVTANTFSSVNAHHFESQNSANVLQQGINTQQNNQNQNILITTTPASNTPTQNESQKVESHGANILNSAANNILNNAPKITPEILNALSNLNPNDQLLIANANGQMQVISQQLLQQFLAGQLNATNQTQNQNQTQKIVIGEPDANNQNLQGVQINTPTSQIIVNSSGGAPTIQNNIQNIVVQAAPSQMPPHIQIQNSSFPSQFIDNLNQQQIKNLGNNQSKKAKIVKKTKVAVTAQSIVNSQTTKTVTATRPTMITTNTSNLQKVDNPNKTNTMVSQNANPAKSESTQVIANGPLVSSSASSHVSVPSNGQMVQRIQTIQLPAHKQQMLKNIHSQIQSLASRKSVSSNNSTLRKLCEEQARIIASGKIVSSTTHPVNSAAEPTFNVSLVSTVASNLHLQNSFKNQTSATQTQTQTSTIAMPVTSQSLNSTTVASVTMPSNTNINYINITNINCTSPNVQGQQPTISNTVTQSIHQSTHTKQHKFYQNHGNQMLNPSSANMQIFSPPITSATTALQLQSNAQQLTQVQTQQHQTSMQQSTQCQTDPLDIKPNIQTPSPVKQELSSPVQVQIQSGSPAGQVTSPRMMGKGTQRIQSPVNTGGNTTKQLISPNSNSSPLISPRQGIKRRATSPICRQLNRSDLMEQQLKIDQGGAINPDMNTPFSSKRDACKRLLRYHCLNEQVLSLKDLAKADERFEETAKHLLGKFNAMMNKYTYLLLMESMREVRTSELMMIDRTFVAEEQNILNRLREQEAKVNEEFKKEEKPLVPKVEPGLIEEDKSTLTSPSLVNVSVKRELEDDFPSDEMECKPVIKTTSSTSGDYDEWLEIQKELGVYPSTADTLRCKTGSNGNSGNSACAVTAVTRSSKIERTRANGECLRANVPSVSNMIMKDDCEQDVTPTPFDRRWSSATDLERDLLEDADSLDGLALHSQAQCPSNTVHVTSSESGNAGNEHDEITAQVQSAIDSILNLKKRPANTLSGSSSGSSSSQSGESKDTALDQAVRSILGS
ncbi:uncharacterized protein LOC126853354 [Cataglyphis hispanica]|uniref:uncharacterized protein LOC126853354 n=1 Tax=Cataglyphis hispanica TaxID=1086592 RepID=UPI00217F6F86|nr:uncharacterized protein LOC126853354 [Cataglyphis hispanica]XP_050454960.1 uncharacterized protein LOC126853354 [Cataglyphis hispanica]XP_050454961.1 uncharacterized protein LOC126853354 [Cataglyphis hispanica]